MSCFFCSSEVGLPISFWRWSYIIFSTIPRVSPSRSLSLLFSGCTCRRRAKEQEEGQGAGGGSRSRRGRRRSSRSGSNTFLVFNSGSEVTSLFHHSILLTFSMLATRHFLSSSTQVLSSSFT